MNDVIVSSLMNFFVPCTVFRFSSTLESINFRLL